MQLFSAAGAAEKGKKKSRRGQNRKRGRKEKEGNDGNTEAPNTEQHRSASSSSRSDESDKKRPKHNNTKQQHSRSGPSAAALELSAKLKDLSAKKQLKEALRLYEDPSNDKIRDGHHGSIMIDCCSRCGDIQQAEKIIANMKSSGTPISVQANSALLKGYAHSGDMKSGINLFRDMCSMQDRQNRPNNRTLNVLLRGCLWTAASVYGTADSDATIVAGGVITSEEAWQLSKDAGIVFDSSSYEYSISLLCQSLQCEEAQERLKEMQKSMGQDDNAVKESIATCTLSLARAYYLKGSKTSAMQYAQEAIDFIDQALQVYESSNHETPCTNGPQSGSKGTGATGGKRSWRQGEDDVSRRTESNVLFRKHRLSEWKNEAQDILTHCKNKQSYVLLQSANFLPQFLASRLLYFSGGGTTGTADTEQRSRNTNQSNDSKSSNEQLILSLWLSFGLASSVGRSITCFDASRLSSESKNIFPKDDRKALKAVGISSSETILSCDGYIDFKALFERGTSETSETQPQANVVRPINIELGAGSGDWIQTQASVRPEEDFVSVEMRSDRVAQTFAKLLLPRQGSGSVIRNVCSVGAECGSFLRQRVHRQSVSSIYVNHPEPPTQTFGSRDSDMKQMSLGSEPAHMLNSETLVAAAQCLLSDGNGRLILVTDNRWYGQLLCKTIELVLQKYNKLLTPVDLNRSHGFKPVPSGTNAVRMYEGTPNEAIGHVAATSDSGGASYFDRLWRTGAGSHAERVSRFCIVLRSYRDGDDVKPSARPSARPSGGPGRPSGGPTSRGGDSKAAHGDSKGKRNRPYKKRSAEKQQARNERRAAKKLAASKSSGAGDE